MLNCSNKDAAVFEVSQKSSIHVVSISSNPVPYCRVGDNSDIIARNRSKCFPHYPCSRCYCHCEVFSHQVHISNKLPARCPSQFQCCSGNQDRHCQQREHKLYQCERQCVPSTSMVLESRRRYQGTSCSGVSSFRPEAASSGNLRVLIYPPDADQPLLIGPVCLNVSSWLAFA